MNSRSFTIALIGTFALGAGCGSSAINGIAGTATASGNSGGSRLPSGPCTPSHTSKAPANGLIADFTDAGDGANRGGIEIAGGIVTYAAPRSAVRDPDLHDNRGCASHQGQRGADVDATVSGRSHRLQQLHRCERVHRRAIHHQRLVLRLHHAVRDRRRRAPGHDLGLSLRDGPGRVLPAARPARRR